MGLTMLTVLIVALPLIGSRSPHGTGSGVRYADDAQVALEHVAYGLPWVLRRDRECRTHPHR